MDTRELIAKVRKIEIRTRRIVDELTGGAYHSVFKGRGVEFSEVRAYQEGDDVRSIDWNVTARMGEPYIKKYVEERELTVALLVDISASGDFGSGGQRKNELAAELAALLSFSAIRNNDRVGLMLFTEVDELYLPPRKGRAHVLRLVRELLACERRRRGTDIARALETFVRVHRRRAVVFLLSDFLDAGYERALRMVNQRHDLVALRVLDPAELRPRVPGFLAIEDAESGRYALLAGNRKPGPDRHSAYARAPEIFRRCAVDSIDLRTGADYLAPLMQFFRRRERRRSLGV